MSEKIRLGFVGAGFMGQVAHIANYAKLRDECDLVAVADLRTGLAEQVARRYGIGAVYRDHRELLSQANVDAVVAIMGYGHHHTVVPDILSAGKHLLTEKPIANDPARARKWAQLATKNNALYLVGYMKRWDLGARYVRDLIARWRESGEFGAFRYLRCNMSATDWVWNHEPPLTSNEVPQSHPPMEPFPDGLSEAEAQFYNMNINFYVHQVNLIRYLIGEDYRLTYTHPDGKVLLATADSGAAVTLEMGLHQLKQTWDEIYHICFDGADIELRMPAPLQRQRNGEIVIRRNTSVESRETVVPNIAPSWAFYEQARGFLECIRNGRLPYDSAREAADDLDLFIAQAHMMSDSDGKLAV